MRELSAGNTNSGKSDKISPIAQGDSLSKSDVSPDMHTFSSNYSVTFATKNKASLT